MRIVYRTLLVFCLSLSATPALYSRDAFEKGDISVNAGFSIGVIGYSFTGYGSSGFPLPVTANVEYALTDRIGVAPYLGFLSRSYGTTGDMYTFTSVSFPTLAASSC